MPLELKMMTLLFYFVAAAVVLATMQAFAVGRREKYIPMWRSLGYEVLVIVLVFAVAALGVLPFAIFIIVVGVYTQREIFSMVEQKPNRRVRITAGAGMVALLIGVYAFGIGAAVALLAGSMIVLWLVGLSLPTERASLDSVLLAGFSLLYPGLFLAYTIAVRQLPDGFVWIVMLYGIIELHDGFAKMFGTLLGSRRPLKRLSPNKSIEGSVAGVAMTLTVLPLMKLWLFSQFPLIALVTVILMIDFFTVTGDLIDSKIKRIVGVKDSGQVIPERGGFLDIYDALIFTSPVFYYFVIYTFL